MIIILFFKFILSFCNHVQFVNAVKLMPKFKIKINYFKMFASLPKIVLVDDCNFLSELDLY